MLDRRQLLLAGAALAGGCAHDATPDAEADAQFRDAVDRMGERSRRTRAFLLRRFDPRRLTAEGRVLYDAVLQGAEADAALSEWDWGQSGAPYPVTHRTGVWRRAAEMRAEDKSDVSARDVARDTNRIAGHAARGVVAPDFVLDAAIPAVEAAAARVRARGTADYEPLAEALEAQAAALQAQRTGAPSEAGVWRLPGGEEYYAQALQLQLGEAIDPRAAHARAVERCRMLQAEADVLLRAHGLTRGDVGERLRTLARDERYLYANSAASKAQAVADMNASLARVRSLLGGAINVADVQAEVRLLPAAQEASGAQGRRQGTNYLVDLGNIRGRPKWTLPSVVHHELIPGHILQAPYERAADAPDLQVRYAGGYPEGWAIYAEQLADECGAFAGDPLARIGYLQWMLFRMARVAGDTGIHVMRWSREQAIAEMRALQGESIAFVNIEEDVTRFAAQPGVAAAQGLSALRIADVREETRRRTGAQFDLARFHTGILRFGPLSPPGLAQAARVAFP